MRWAATTASAPPCCPASLWRTTISSSLASASWFPSAWMSNFFTHSDRAYPLEEGKLFLPPQVFGLDTVVLEHMPVRQVTLANRKNPIRLTMDFEQFDYLGIWTKAAPQPTNYICIEPWSTLPECAFTNSALEEKPGIRRLAPGAEEELSYQVTVSGI